jgi:hypothetical protein
MIALNVGCGVAMDWIQTFVMLSEAKHLCFCWNVADTDDQRFFGTLRMTGNHP